MAPPNDKKTFCSLYAFVREHNNDLFEILDDMCASGLFRRKHPATFLNPSKELVKELLDLINKGDSDKAFEHLQSLFIYGKHENLKGELISYNKHLIKTDLSGLKQSKAYKAWSNKDNIVVYDYNLPKFPEKGDRKDPVLKKGKGVDGGVWPFTSNNKITLTDKICDYPSYDDQRKKFIYALNSLMTHIKDNNTTVFEKIKKLLDPNITLSWFILVQPNKKDNMHIDHDIFNTWYKSYNVQNPGTTTTLQDIFTNAITGKGELQAIKAARDELKYGAGYSETISIVKQQYGNDMNKLLEDELRFRYSDSECMDKDTLIHLKQIDWNNPEKELILFSEAKSGCLYKQELYTLMTKFKESSAFLYTLLGKDLLAKFNKSISGAGDGRKMINILGGSNRDFIGSMESVNYEQFASEFVRSLSGGQKKIFAKCLADEDDD